MGCSPTNLNPQANPHLTAPFAYPLLTPSDIPPAPPVFHRSPPACTDRASSESLRDAECPAQFSVRLSPCSLACCLGCDAGCEARILPSFHSTSDQRTARISEARSAVAAQVSTSVK